MRRSLAFVLLAASMAASSALTPAWAGTAEDEARVAAWFEQRSLLIPSWSRIIVCHGYGCTFRTAIALQPKDRVTFAAMMKAANPEAERRGIAKVVQWFDKRVAPETGTGKARAMASGLAGNRTQFDCVDRTTNTTSVLTVLSQWKLLKFHEVDAPVSRLGVILGGAPHSTAVVTELTSRKSWSIDPWTRNSGELPDVKPLDQWLAVYRDR